MLTASKKYWKNSPASKRSWRRSNLTTISNHSKRAWTWVNAARNKLKVRKRSLPRSIGWEVVPVQEVIVVATAINVRFQPKPSTKPRTKSTNFHLALTITARGKLRRNLKNKTMITSTRTSPWVGTDLPKESIINHQFRIYFLKATESQPSRPMNFIKDTPTIFEITWRSYRSVGLCFRLKKGWDSI